MAEIGLVVCIPATNIGWWWSAGTRIVVGLRRNHGHDFEFLVLFANSFSIYRDFLSKQKHWTLKPPQPRTYFHSSAFPSLLFVFHLPNCLMT
ncbi:hypothetical protein ACOSQ2_007162 [Xanthoceras sorbifolium]